MSSSSGASAAAENPSSRSSSTVWILVASIGVYLLVRLLTIPSAAADSAGFGHDSAYLWMIASNLIEGHGFVNFAHWLVFLDPEGLPVPFHNGNPLYPALIAVVAGPTGWDVARVGFALNALANVGLVFAVAWLLQVWKIGWTRGLLLGLVAAVFAPVIEVSYMFGTDALSLLLLVLFAGALVRDSAFSVALGGLLLGLAWLVRSDAVLVLPAAGLYLWSRHGFVDATIRVLATLGLAALVASPWLLHTWTVWGSPLRSDSAYYLLQDWHAQEMGGIEVMQYWHSAETPPGLAEVVGESPGAFFMWTLMGVQRVVRRMLAEWSSGRAWVGILLLIGGLWGLKTLMSRRWKEVFALGVAAATYVGIFSIRSYSFEPRYVGLLAVFFVVMVGVGLFELGRAVHRTERGKAFVGVGLVVGALGLLLPTAHAVAARRAVNAPLAEYRAVAASVVEEVGTNAPVVVGDAPYWFTQTTRVPALSMPYSDDEFLIRYMDKYGARYLALTPAELAYWRPAWASEGAPVGLERVRSPGEYLLWRRRTE